MDQMKETLSKFKLKLRFELKLQNDKFFMHIVKHEEIFTILLLFKLNVIDELEQRRLLLEILRFEKVDMLEMVLREDVDVSEFWEFYEFKRNIKDYLPPILIPILKFKDERKRLKAVKLLVDKGVDIDNVIDYETPLSLAVLTREGDVSEFLISRGANTKLTIFHMLQKVDVDLKGLEFILERSDYPNGAVKRDFPNIPSLLHIAIQAYEKVSYQITKLFISFGADVNAYCGPEGTPLMTAAKKQRLDIVFLLLESGAKPTKKDGNGRTFEHFLNKKNKKQLGRGLLKRELGQDLPNTLLSRIVALADL